MMKVAFQLHYRLDKIVVSIVLFIYVRLLIILSLYLIYFPSPKNNK